MIKKMSYQWNLRKIMATRDMFATTDLVPLLAERGIHLSREQVFRLVTTTPQRLSLDTLAALCDILDVGVEDLIEITVANTQVAKTAGRVRKRRHRRRFGAPPSAVPKGYDAPRNIRSRGTAPPTSRRSWRRNFRAQASSG